MAGHGNRGFLPVHDRHCPALRQRICPKLAFSAFTDGIWAVVFWVGAVGIGFGIPLIASLIAGKNTESKVSFYFAGTCAIAGMMCLRLFILYAGQMNTIV